MFKRIQRLWRARGIEREVGRIATYLGKPESYLYGDYYTFTDENLDISFCSHAALGRVYVSVSIKQNGQMVEVYRKSRSLEVFREGKWVQKLFEYRHRVNQIVQERQWQQQLAEEARWKPIEEEA